MQCIHTYLVILVFRSWDSASSVNNECKILQRSDKLDISSSSPVFCSGFAAQVQLNRTFRVFVITVASSSFRVGRSLFFVFSMSLLCLFSSSFLSFIMVIQCARISVSRVIPRCSMYSTVLIRNKLDRIQKND